MWHLFRLAWSEIVLSGYYNSPQGMGQVFEPNVLRGYFNDLTHKADWEGPFTERVPHVRLAPHPVTSPVLVFQYGLGHWDRHLLGRRTSYPSFLAAAEWAACHQDGNGGWRAWDHQRPHRTPETEYSAMAQGQGLSLLARAYAETNDARFFETGGRALDLMMTPVDQGGTLCDTPFGPVLEELPAATLDGTLNGWIFALFGLHDWSLIAPESEAGRLLEQTRLCLEHHLDEFDRGYWSNYDLVGNIAKPFYHRLHIDQFAALAAAFPDQQAAFMRFRRLLLQQQVNRVRKARAILVKATQVARRKWST